MASHVVRGLAALAIVVAVVLPTELTAAKKVTAPTKKPIRDPKFDPSAAQVDLFEAVDEGQVTIKLTPKDALGGTVLIENKTKKPLTVKIPEAVVGISIHAQIGNQGLGNPFGGGGNGALNNGAGNPFAGGMGQQMQGGGVGMNMMNQGNNLLGNGQGNGIQNPGIGQQMNPGAGFFSIPAEKVISLTFKSVCLEHGKPEPDASSRYTLIPVSKVSNDPVLYQLLAAVGTGAVDAQAAQAAVWHQANKMSFQELADKMHPQLPGTTPASYFTPEQIQQAKVLVTQATTKAATPKAADQSLPKTETSVTATTPSRIPNN
jgi:hypothetical protein